MRALRWVLVAAGVVMIGVGVSSLRDEDGTQLLSTVLWLAGGVLVHDAVLAPLTVAVVALGARFVPVPARAAALVGLVVWGAVTLATANVLLGVGGRPDNDTLLNRPYGTWWIVLTLVWWAGVAAVGWLAVRRRAAP